MFLYYMEYRSPLQKEACNLPRLPDENVSIYFVLFKREGNEYYLLLYLILTVFE